MKLFFRLAILAGAAMLLLAAGFLLQNQVTGYEAGERAQAILDEVWPGVQEKLGIADADGGDMASMEDGLPDADSTESGAPAAVPTDGCERVLDDEYAGVLEIPALSITLCVYDEWSYPLLRNSPCKYAGNADGTPDRLVIVGHNYARHFGNLKTLSVGDSVLYMNMYGEVFQYVITDTEVINPRDYDSLNEGDWSIALVTCTVGGRQRVVVKCRQVLP